MPSPRSTPRLSPKRRPGGGRKPLPESERKVRLVLYVHPSTKQALDLSEKDPEALIRKGLLLS